MHELSIVLEIVRIAAAAAAAAAEAGGTAVKSVHLRIGPLAGVVEESLHSAYEIAIDGTPLAGSVLVVESMPIVIRCHTCVKDATVDLRSMVCPQCESANVDVVGGRELEVYALEIES